MDKVAVSMVAVSKVAVSKVAAANEMDKVSLGSMCC